VSFGAPLFLLALLIVPLALLGWHLLQRRQARYAVRYTNLDVLASVTETTHSWRRQLGLVLFLLALTLLLAGLARPAVTRLAEREEATVVLVIDTSGSMFATDVKPTRLEAARKVVREFMRDLPERFQVGVVAFAEQTEVVAPASEDHELAVDSLEYLFPRRGTAIGDAIARAVQVGRSAPGAGTKQRPIAILLLSDGAQTAGTLAPLEGAARAKSFGIPVYTVALGTPEGVVELSRYGSTRVIPVPPDPETLSAVARSTGGRFYEAKSAGDLRDAYKRLGSLVSKVEREQEVSFAFVGAGLALLLGAAAVGALTFPRLP